MLGGGLAKTLAMASTVAVAAGLVFTGALLRDRDDEPGSGEQPPALAPPDLWNEPFLPGSTPPSTFHLDDPAGDATDTGAGDATTTAYCALGGVVDQGCLDGPASPVPAGTPGPHFDIVAVDYVGETANTVAFAMQIGRLSEGFKELVADDQVNRMVFYQICWAATEDTGCDWQAKLEVMAEAGMVHANPVFEIRTKACNEWSWCSWGVKFDVEFGAPATLTWTIPKAYLYLGDVPLSVHHLQGQVSWISEPAAFPAWHPGVTARTPIYHFHTHGALVSGLNIPDVTEPVPVSLEFAAPPSRPVLALDEPLMYGGEGANHGASSKYNYPEMDIVWFDLYEEAGDLVALFAIRELPAVPNYDFDYSVAVGVGDKVWEIGYRHESGKAYGYSGRCIMEMCQDGEIITPPVEVTTGSPGFIAVRTPLAFLGDPEPGTETNLFWAMTMYSDGNVYWGEYGDQAYGDVHSVFEIDSLRGGGLPYVFGSGHRAPLDYVAPDAHGAHP